MAYLALAQTGDGYLEQIGPLETSTLRFPKEKYSIDLPSCTGRMIIPSKSLGTEATEFFSHYDWNPTKGGYSTNMYIRSFLAQSGWHAELLSVDRSPNGDIHVDLRLFFFVDREIDGVVECSSYIAAARICNDPAERHRGKLGNLFFIPEKAVPRNAAEIEEETRQGSLKFTSYEYLPKLSAVELPLEPGRMMIGGTTFLAASKNPHADWLTLFGDSKRALGPLREFTEDQAEKLWSPFDVKRVRMEGRENHRAVLLPETNQGDVFQTQWRIVNTKENT